MSRKRLLIIIITIVCVLLILIAAYNINTNTPKTSENPPPNNSPEENLPESIFVIPENPVGTLGLISAIATALAVFAIANKRKKASK